MAEKGEAFKPQANATELLKKLGFVIHDHMKASADIRLASVECLNALASVTAMVLRGMQETGLSEAESIEGYQTIMTFQYEQIVATLDKYLGRDTLGGMN